MEMLLWVVFWAVGYLVSLVLIRFLNKFEDENSTSYNMARLLKLAGPLNYETLERALKEIVQRHESLRTNFKDVNGQSLQVISQKNNFKLEQFTGTMFQSYSKIKEIMGTSFNLSEDLLFRAVVYSYANEEYYLLIHTHNIVFDGWSFGVLFQELSTLYNAYTKNNIAKLSPLEVQYPDFSSWQREYLSGDRLEAKLQYWRNELKDLPVLNLETSFPRPKKQSYKGKTIKFEIDDKVKEGLYIINTKHDTTLFMTLLTSFSILLHRYTGQDDIVIGTITANRNRSEIENLIGNFVNTLAIRQKYHFDIEFSELLLQVKERILNAYEHQEVPFEKVVDTLDIKRDLSLSPVFQVLFALQNHEDIGLKLDGLKVESQELEGLYSKFDLSLGMGEKDGKLIAGISYATDLFSQTYIESLIENFQCLLKEITKDVSQKVISFKLKDEQYNKSESYIKI